MNSRRHYVGAWHLVADVKGRTAAFDSLAELARCTDESATMVRIFVTGYNHGRAVYTPELCKDTARSPLDGKISRYEIVRMPEELSDEVRKNAFALQDYRNALWASGKMKDRRSLHRRWIVRLVLADGTERVCESLDEMAGLLYVDRATIADFLNGAYTCNRRKCTVTPETLDRHEFLLDGIVAHYEIIETPGDNRNALALQEARNSRRQ